MPFGPWSFFLLVWLCSGDESPVKPPVDPELKEIMKKLDRDSEKMEARGESAEKVEEQRRFELKISRPTKECEALYEFCGSTNIDPLAMLLHMRKCMQSLKWRTKVIQGYRNLEDKDADKYIHAFMSNYDDLRTVLKFLESEFEPALQQRHDALVHGLQTEFENANEYINEEWKEETVPESLEEEAHDRM